MLRVFSSTKLAELNFHTYSELFAWRISNKKIDKGFISNELS